MNKLTKSLFFAAVCAAIMIPVYQFASACQVDEFYHTREGALAASTPETLHAAITYQEEGNADKLAGLVKSGAVRRLSENIKVQVLERSFDFKMLKIKFLDEKDPYWVTDGSLKQINCK
jgi:hypothetical protein